MSDMNNYRNDFLNGIKAAQGLPQGPNQPPRVEQGGPGMINCTNDNRPGIYSNLQGNMVFSPDSVHAIKPGMEAIPQTQPPMYNHPMPQQQQMPFPQRPIGSEILLQSTSGFSGSLYSSMSHIDINIRQ